MTMNRIPRLLVTWGCLLALLFLTTVASAYGRVQWKSTRLKEREASGGSWRIELTIFLNKAPDLPTVPAKFEFKQIVYYERYKDDDHGNKAMIRKVPTPGKEPIIESVDMGFLDPGEGKIQKRTKFSFKITRAHGFEAGEWSVTIKDARNGTPIGTTQRVVLEGDNEVIDRRSMVFASGDKKKKKKEEPETNQAAFTQLEQAEDEENWDEDESANAPPPVEEKPGACGCRTAGTPTGSPLALLLASTLVLGGWLRRRRGLVA